MASGLRVKEILRSYRYYNRVEMICKYILQNYYPLDKFFKVDEIIEMAWGARSLRMFYSRLIKSIDKKEKEILYFVDDESGGKLVKLFHMFDPCFDMFSEAISIKDIFVDGAEKARERFIILFMKEVLKDTIDTIFETKKGYYRSLAGLYEIIQDIKSLWGDDDGGE